ncbi:MAG TPA: AI-2E family transporter [Kofleriaceae bacterium]|nr:AI-2E family transporter [Kofleriaceae bacterium]
MQAQAPLPRQVAQVLSLLRWLLILVFVVLGWLVLKYLTGVLAPILAAMGIAYLLDPVLERLVRRGVNRALGAGLLLASFIGAIAILITIATPKIAHQLSDFIVDLPHQIDNLNVWLGDRLGMEIPNDWKQYLSSIEVRDAMGHSSGAMRTLAAAALGGVFSVLGVLAELLLVPVFAFYFLVDWPNLLRRIEHAIPPRRRSVVRDLAREIDRVIANWVRGQGIVTSILAVLYAIGFTIVGMPLSVPIGLLVGVLTIIPFVGTFVGASIAALVTVAGGGGTHTLGGVAAVIIVLHLLEAGVLTPKIVGHRVGLSESGALLAVVAGGKLLGFVGVVLAVPIAATVAVLARYAFRYYATTEFFGRESDADVVVTPAMALIMPGTAWTPAVWEDGASLVEDNVEGLAEIELPDPTTSDDWLLKEPKPEGSNEP